MNREERLHDYGEALRLAMEGYAAGLWTALPGVVEAVDLDAQTLHVQPSIRGRLRGSDGVWRDTDLPLLVDVPIVWPRAGGFALTFPITAGDEVLVVFASRCIDSWWQSGGIGAQAEVRMHDLSDGFGVLAPTSQPKKLSGVSGANVQLRDTSGTSYVEITPDGKVRLVAATTVEIGAPTIRLASAHIQLVGPVTQTAGTFTIGGIQFGTHVHGGVQTGGSDTDGPDSP